MNAKRWCNFEKLSEAVAVQYRAEEDSVHGPSHWRRVERNGLILSYRTGADVLVVRLFAWFHDSRRINDYTDSGHGFRGTEYVASLRGELFDLEDAAFQSLTYACTWHTDKVYSEDITIGTCWDADRLDLARVGVIPSVDFMSTQAGKELAYAGGRL
jgi:uncharacterized protein